MSQLVSFILPTLNEENGLKQTLSMIPTQQLEQHGYQVETIVVDGGSNDGTQQVAKHHGVSLIVKDGGYGVGVLTGLKHAQGDIIIVSDADNTYPVELSPQLLLLMEQHDLDFLTTDRLTHSSRIAFPPPHLVGNKLLNLLFLFLFGILLTDSQTGLLLFRRHLVNIDLLACFGNHFAFNSELKYFLYRQATNWGEVAIPYRRRVQGETKQEWHVTGPKILLSWLTTRLRTFLYHDRFKNKKG